MHTKRSLLGVTLGICAGPLVAIASASGSYQLALVAIVGAAAAIAVVTHPSLGLLATAFMIPVERFGRITDDSSAFTISLMRLVGLLALAGLILHVLLKKQRVQLGAAFWLYLAYGTLAGMSMLYSTDIQGTVRSCGLLASNVLFFVVVIGLCRSFWLIKCGTLLWIVATVLIGLYTMVDWHLLNRYIEGNPNLGLVTQDRFRTVSLDNSEWEIGMHEVRRAVGSTSHYASYGINLIVTVPFLFFFLRQRRRWYIKAVLWVSLGVVCYNALLTNTRATLMFLAATLLMCVARRLLVIKLPMVLAAVLGTAAFLPLVDTAIYERVFDPSMYTAKGSSTLRIRLTYWRAGWEVIQDHWLLGRGLGNELEVPQHVKMKWVPARTSVHNVYLNTLIELGVVGFAIFFCFVGLLLYQSFQAARLLRQESQEEAYWYLVACQIAMISVLLFGLQCEVFLFPLKGWWYVAGVTVVMHRMALNLSRRPVTEVRLPDEELLCVA